MKEDIGKFQIFVTKNKVSRAAIHGILHLRAYKWLKADNKNLMKAHKMDI